MKNHSWLIVSAFLLIVFTTKAQIPKAPTRAEGDGPWSQLIIRGVTLINSTGAPPIGPVDIVVEKNRIKQVEVVGFPSVTIDSARRPKLKAGGNDEPTAVFHIRIGLNFRKKLVKVIF